MIKIKNVFDRVEPDDRDRLWIEPVGLTKDLQDWCSVQHVLPHLGPPAKLWQWFQQHPEGYEEFRARYHHHLSTSPYKRALEALAAVGLREDFTLVHQGDDPAHNTATALYEYLVELQAYVPPET